MILTGAFLIRASELNRGSSVGTVQTVKKVSFFDGRRPFFSQVSYKRALWDSLQKDRWSPPILYTVKSKEGNEGGVTQRHGTIIDSEELDFAGTMIAKTGKSNNDLQYQRQGVLVVGKGISITDYMGDMDFLTNAGLVKKVGENSLVNRENVYTLYLMPFALEINRAGIQTITLSITKTNNDIKDDDDIPTKMRKIYRAFGLEDEYNKREIEKRASTVEYINVVNKTDKTMDVEIKLTDQERLRRIRELLFAMGDLSRYIEGRVEILSPVFAAFSFDYYSPKYMYAIEKNIQDQYARYRSYGGNMFVVNLDEIREEIKKMSEQDKRNIYTATFEDYNAVVSDIIGQIEKGMNV